jgi:hypothetical protein
MSDSTADGGTDFKIIPAISSSRTILGISELEIVAAVFVPTVLWFIARQMVGGTAGSLINLMALAWLLIAFGFIMAKEPWQSAAQYTITTLRAYSAQPTMVFDRNPDSSGIEQRTNDSWSGKIASVPIKALEGLQWMAPDFIDLGPPSPEEKAGDRPTRTQDFVQFKKAYHGTPAIETDEGNVVGAIQIDPANMVTASDDEWKRQARFYAKILDTAVNGKVQVSEYMRMVDYTSRIERYVDREEEIITTADGEAAPGEIDYHELDFGQKVLADLCQERADVVSTYDLSTFTVDPYIIVEVAPKDVVSSDDVEGGLTSIPLVGRAYSYWKVRQLRKSGDHVPQMIELLESRLDSLSGALRRLEDVSGHTIPSERLSQVAADHYQAANAYAHADYTALVRQAPIPVPEPATSYEGEAAATDPEYEVTYSHLDVEAGRDPRTTLSRRHNELAIADRHRSQSEPSEPSEPSEHTYDEHSDEQEAAADGGVITQGEGQSFEDATAAAEAGSADIALTDEELEEQYISLLAPEEIERSWIEGHGNHLKIDGEVYSATMFISSYPKDPQQGFLEPVLRFDDAKVQTNVTTHIDTIDQDSAEVELEDYADALEKKYERVKNSRIEMFAERYKEEAKETRSALNSFLESEHDMYEAQTYIEVRSYDPDALKQAIRTIRAKMSDMSAEVSVLRQNHDVGHQTVAPACQDKVGQKVKVRAEALAAMNPWTTTNLHEPSGVEIAENRATNEPIAINIFDRDAGYNWNIIGKTGAGKTVTSSQILWRHKTLNPDHFMAVIDPLREFDNLYHIFGGAKIVVGSTRLNPFDMKPTPPEKIEAIGEGGPWSEWMNSNKDFLELYYSMEGLDFSKYSAIWTQALKKAAREKGITKDPQTHDPEYRKEQGYTGELPTITDCLEIINDMSSSGKKYVRDPSNEAQVENRERRATEVINNHVEPFREGGELEHLAHETEVDLSESNFVYADLQLKEGDEDGGGLMMHLVLDLLYNEVKSRPEPGMIFCDEFHYLLRDDMTVRSLSQKYRHHRHWDLSIGTGTQSHEDFFGTDEEGNKHLTDNAEIMFRLSAMEIYQFVEGMTPEWGKDLGLSKEEAEMISDLQKGNQADGFSEVLLRIDDEGCYPGRVRMEIDDYANPREAVALLYDPSDHGEDYEEYLRSYDDVCNWRWS